MPGPTQEFSDRLHAEKYRTSGESFEYAMCRVATALGENEQHYRAFLDILMDMRFMPAGRIQAGAGAERAVTLANCLAGGTEILTYEHGVVPIKDVAGTVVHLLDGNSEWVPCPIVEHGEQETYVLTMKNGKFRTVNVRATLDHGWVTPEGVRETGEVSEIMYLAPRKTVTNEIEYQQGVVHGVIYGDGSQAGYGAKIRVCSGAEDIEYFFRKFQVTYPEYAEGDPVYYIKKPELWEKHLKQLPGDDVSMDYLLGFIRGWFFADGCVSEQPEASICVGTVEEEWLRINGPKVGWQFSGSSPLALETNYGRRNKDSRNLRIWARSISTEDLLYTKHRNRWTDRAFETWKVMTPPHSPRMEKVYCPVVSTTHSFSLGKGIHSRNCYVLPIDDSFVEGSNSIMGAALKAATTMRMGGGVGYDFSGLRPKGALIRSLGSTSSGPVAFMEIFDAVCRATSSAGNRRGAQMGILRVDHPDVEEFIEAKQNSTRLTGFNISLAITNEFMEALLLQRPFDLRWGNKRVRAVDPAVLWEKIMRSTWDYAEPGVYFIDRANEMNNLWYCEHLAATNPCAEQPLPSFGACFLGSFNLVKYVSGGHFDFDQLREDVVDVVPAMDNAVSISLYPLPEQRGEATAKRRMGLGVTGLANAAEALGFPYGSASFLAFQTKVLSLIRDQSYLTSAMLADAKGPFPLFDREKYLAGAFIKTLDPEVRGAIGEYGIRNSHLTSIAPTGTISLCADNVSSGIEPVFSYEQSRKVIGVDGTRVETIQDYGVRVFGVEGRRTSDVTLDEHLAVLACAQRLVDSAVSKTCNVPPGTSWDDFKGVYVKAWQMGCKGITTFNTGGKRAGILTSNDDAPEVEGGACRIDPATGTKTCDQ